MAEVPSGTVTFLFTDIEGSSVRWEKYPAAMRAALARHDALLQEGIVAHHGVVLTERGEGDSFFALFARPSDALAATCALQRALLAEPWPPEVAPLRVRMALHTGEAGLREGSDYRGATVNRCARLRAVAHGGQILLSQATSALVRDSLPPAVSLRDLGEHRLKDLTRPEHIFQALIPDGPTDFPPLRSLDATPHNLPVHLTSFVGREHEIAAITQTLATTRLLTLTGAGGAGKTRLALQVAADLVADYPEGVWFVDLAPLADPTLVPATAAAVVGVRESSERPAQESLVAALRARRVLLVLDNCEHLLEACAALADALVRGCPHVHVLATSRAPLGLAGETVRRVPSLAVPAPGRAEPLERLTQYEAVRLFIERAVAARGDFRVSTATAPTLSEICARLDGIPLAIELAAARVRVLGLEQLARRLDDRFRLLTGGSRTALPRQQTLRALVDWSHDLLSEGEQVVLRRLSVFAGGWTLEAAEAICAGEGIAADEVLDRLGGLVDQSLVQAEEAGDELRYGLLETIREYGRERLEARGEAEAAAVRQRHAAYYLALTEHAAPYLNGPEEPVWLAWLDAERENVRAALRWFLARGAAAEGLRLASALSWYWYKRDAQAEGSAWLTRALALPDPAPGVPRARALIVAGRNANVHGDATAAQQLLEAALTLGQQLDDRDTIAQALLWLGPAAQWQGDDRLARARLEESLALFRTLDDRRGIAEALCNLSRSLTQLGEQTLAQSCIEEALTLARGAGEWRQLAFALELRGELAFAREEDAEAARLWQESLALYSEISMGIGIVTVENFLGQLALRQGDHATARVRYVASLEHQQGWPALPWTIGALAGLATVAVAEGQAARGLRLAGACAALGEAAGLHLPRAEREVVERAIASARAALGERQADAEWATGQVLQVEQAIASALEPQESGDAPA